MSWKNPAYVHTKPFSRVLALGLSDKAKIRADFEDALAAQLAETGLETDSRQYDFAQARRYHISICSTSGHRFGRTSSMQSSCHD